MHVLKCICKACLRNERGFTFVEIIVTIAIISIMVAIFTFSYSVGRQYDTLKGEEQRLAAVLRNARIRDFNGIIAYDPAISDERYPIGGYGLYITNDAFACSNDDDFFCSFPAGHPDDECVAASKGTCIDTAGTRTSYVLFADLNGDGLYNDRDEFLERFSVAKNFQVTFGEDPALKRAYLIFKNNQLTAKEAGTNGEPVVGFTPQLRCTNDPSVTCTLTTEQAACGAAGACGYVMDINYVPGCSKVQNKKAHVQVFSRTSTIADQVIDC
ncbi:MAG: prepilin-type N-terminal cleavage/methylation domain-containing protein [Patescibacteria group bacterium]